MARLNLTKCVRGVIAMGERVKRIKEIIIEWSPGIDTYLLCLTTVLILPLVPVMAERLWKGTISEQTGLISAAMYSISIGLSSTWKFQFGLGVVLSVLFSILFGISLAGAMSGSAIGGLKFTPVDMSLLCIGCIFSVHALERFIRHVLYRQPLLPG